MLPKLLYNIEKEGTLPNSFYETKSWYQNQIRAQHNKKEIIDQFPWWTYTQSKFLHYDQVASLQECKDGLTNTNQ
jgi:hypothetical protein